MPYHGAKDGKHYWLTPADLMWRLQAEFGFNFDACPYPRPEGFDGLDCEWRSSTYVNPPFGGSDPNPNNLQVRNGKRRLPGVTAWARKAITEYRNGKRVVLVFPLDKWVLMLLGAGARVRNLGDVHWHSIEENKPGSGTGRHVAMFVLDPNRRPKAGFRHEQQMDLFSNY